MENPLLQPFDVTPFSQAETAHFKPAFLKAMEDARAEINAIAENKKAPGFENTVAALDFAG